MKPIPHHVFSPGNIGLPYAKEVDKYISHATPGLWIQEHDVEIGPETAKRFEEYIRKEPQRIHTAPYLYRNRDIKGDENLVWVNRNVTSQNAGVLKKKVLSKMRHYLPGQPSAMQITIAAAISIQGGEKESHYFGLGCTYIPRKIWNLIAARVIDIDWQLLDTRISEATMLLGHKAILHWDCVASHAHV